MTLSFPSLLLSFSMAYAAGSVHAAGAEVSANNIGKEDLQREHIAFTGDVVTAMNVQDKNGVHILVLTAVRGESRERASHGRVERIDLRASYYSRADGKPSGAWAEKWNIKDGVDCPGLDSEAAFFASRVTVTDLNKDGIAEVTVPYKMFCGGGIDSDTIKIIMRQNGEKFALRGESLVRLPGQEGFGGTYKMDATLSLPGNAAYKQHLLSVWKQIYIRKNP
jgi:hypothetical protein